MTKNVTKDIIVKNDKKSPLGFEETLWQAADKLRGHIDASEYKSIVLGMIFLKYISDLFKKHYESLRTQDMLDPESAENYHKFNVFWIPKVARWEYLSKNKSSIGSKIDQAMQIIEKENSSLKNVLPKIYSKISTSKNKLVELFDLIGKINFIDDQNGSQDILGRVYEYFLGKFASSMAKGGEFYTPESIVNLLVNMLEPDQGIIYDPCCGSGGMFVQSQNFVKAHDEKDNSILVYGQESNASTWRLCKMNLAVRGINGNLGNYNADTFNDDLHKQLKADFILANPPFNDSDWGGDNLQNDIRWKYGIPPNNNANYAWIQHIIHHLSDNGLAGIILSNGTLSSKSIEQKIRRQIIEDDLIDCIVSLPNQLFYTTQISSCIWIISKNKNCSEYRNRQGQTLFIYGSDFGEMIDKTHRQLKQKEIKLITETYQKWKSQEGEYQDILGFCKSVTLEEIKEHKMSLVAGRYVGFNKQLIETWESSQLKSELLELEKRMIESEQLSQFSLNIIRRLING